MLPEPLGKYELLASGSVLSLRVNGHYLKVLDYSADMPMDIEPLALIQGGERAAVLKFGERTFTASITANLQVDRNGVVVQALKALFLAAERPKDTTVRLDIDVLLLYPGLLVLAGLESKSQSLAITKSIIEKVEITATNGSDNVALTFSLVSVIEDITPTNQNTPSELETITRDIGWNECQVGTDYWRPNAMAKISATVTNTVVRQSVYVPAGADNRQTNSLPNFPYDPGIFPDQLRVLGVSQSIWQFSIDVLMRRGIESSREIVGGMQTQGVAYTHFGPLHLNLKSPVINTKRSPISAGFYKRNYSFIGQNLPGNYDRDHLFDFV